MGAQSPAIMVSSTFYDLKHARSELARFLSDELGYRALLSELPSFPVEPDADTIENCRRRVEQDADVLVLIVGGRYGSVDSSSAKSVTNIEYLAARAKGIPVLAFVDRAVLNLLPIWRNNPSADFRSAVDNVAIFAFIQEVHDVHKVWTHQFGSVQDIVGTLRIQLAYLMREGLDLRLRLLGSQPGSSLRRLQGQALRVALERPDGWRYLLFGHVLKNEISSASDLRREYDLGLALGLSDYVSVGDIEAWTRPRTEEMTGVIATIDVLLGGSLQTAFGSSDLDAIVFVAERLGAVYRRTIEWAQQVRRVAVDEELKPVLRGMADLASDMIDKLGAFPDVILERVRAALAGPPGTSHTIELKLHVDSAVAERFGTELRQAVERIRRRRMG